MTRREGRRDGGRDRGKGRRAAAQSSATMSDGDANALLPVALHHHQQGNFERAKALYEQLITADPQHADGLQYFGILCEQCGDAVRAEALIRQAIAVKADVAPYHDNLGTVLEHSGRLDDALRAYEEADRLEPGDADRAFNLGVVLEQLGRIGEAERRYREVLEHRPLEVDCLFALANLLKVSGSANGNAGGAAGETLGESANEAMNESINEAIAIYRQILAIDATHVAAHINLGNALQDRGELESALEQYRVATECATDKSADSANAYHNQGLALLRSNRPTEAAHSFEQALRAQPVFVDARLGLARALETLGRFDRAYAAYRAVVVGDDTNAKARSGLLRVARVLALERYDEVLVDVLLAAIDSGAVCASSYSRTLGMQLAAKAQIFNGGVNDAGRDDGEGKKECDADALAHAIVLQHDPLWRVTLEQCVNVVPQLEKWLCAVRRALLHADAAQLVGREQLLLSLALQCAANEYVFAVTDTEVGVVDAVLAQLEALDANELLGSANNVRDLLLCACYGPLTDLWGVVSLASVADEWQMGPWLAPIVQRAVVEPLREKALADPMAGTIVELAPIEDSASQLVRAQYEEHPYPRWREMESIAPVNEALDNDPASTVLANNPGASILVAGCGTGYEPLMLARRYPNHPIVAIDLSRASLAYAARMAEDFNIDSVRFIQADLHDVARLERQFALVTATGVLHHLAEPIAGWRALRDCLQPNGVMKIALYSRRARAVVNAARERVAALGLLPTAQGVRRLRARVLAGDEPALASLLDSEDFYTTSVCRDLIFHPLEHQFDLHEVEALFESLRLNFAGFELPHALIRREFVAARFGGEQQLSAWNRFEEANPRTFDAMYVMWCRKMDERDGKVERHDGEREHD